MEKFLKSLVIMHLMKKVKNRRLILSIILVFLAIVSIIYFSPEKSPKRVEVTQNSTNNPLNMTQSPEQIHSIKPSPLSPFNSSDATPSIGSAQPTSSPSTLPYNYLISENKNGDFTATDCTSGTNILTSNDATLVIQTVINLASSGQAIYLKSGIYQVNYQLTIGNSERVCLSIINKSNISIIGETGTTLKLADNQNATVLAIFNSALQNHITGIIFDGNKINNPGINSGMLHPDGITISVNSNYNKIDGCEFTNFRSHPLLIISRSDRNVIYNNSFYNNDWYDIAASGGSFMNVFQNNVINSSIGMESFLKSDTIMTDNSLFNSPRSNAVASAVSSIHLDGKDIVSSNVIYNSSRSGIIASPDDQPQEIYNNTIVNPCGNRVGGDAGIFIDGNNKNVTSNTIIGSFGHGIYIEYGNFSIIARNRITNSSLMGILIYERSQSNVIIENRIFNNFRDIDIEGSPQPSYTIIRNNDLSDSSSTCLIYDRGLNTEIMGNIGYNPMGRVREPIAGSTHILVDAGTNSTWISGVTYVNTQSPKTISVNGGSVSSIIVNEQSMEMTNGPIILQPLDKITITFSIPPIIEVTAQ